MEAKMDLQAAAIRLRRSREQTVRLMLTGVLQGERDGRGRWQITTSSVERLLRQERTLPNQGSSTGPKTKKGGTTT